MRSASSWIVVKKDFSMRIRQRGSWKRPVMRFWIVSSSSGGTKGSFLHGIQVCIHVVKTCAQLGITLESLQILRRAINLSCLEPEGPNSRER